MDCVSRSSCMLLVILLFCAKIFQSEAYSELNCLVCKKVVKEFLATVKKEDPRKKIQVGNYRIEADGSPKPNTIQYAGSEIHLSEVLETICSSMDDYAQAKHKETGQLALLKMTEDMDKLGTYDFVPDPELNKGLKFHCENILSDFDEDIVKDMKGSTDIELEVAEAKICNTITKYCGAGPKRQEL